MSRLSSTAKRYAGSSYSGHYGSYSSSLTPGLGSYGERDRLSSYVSPMSSTSSSGYCSSNYLSSSTARSRNYSTLSDPDRDRGRTVPRTDILGSSSSRRSESLSRTPVKSCRESGLSGGGVLRLLQLVPFILRPVQLPLLLTGGLGHLAVPAKIRLPERPEQRLGFPGPRRRLLLLQPLVFSPAELPQSHQRCLHFLRQHFPPGLFRPLAELHPGDLWRQQQKLQRLGVGARQHRGPSLPQQGGRNRRCEEWDNHQLFYVYV
ncbi:uncharacterized protein [Takifugu rubripes]|uniref:uncharacterized protein n=1 Tax=Takifugu rubripes TaxID=31033 RepID=UPI001145FA4B|nr:uncharacterized protein LOC101062254 [Takifugu rubripes]